MGMVMQFGKDEGSCAPRPLQWNKDLEWKLLETGLYHARAWGDGIYLYKSDGPGNLWSIHVFWKDWVDDDAGLPKLREWTWATSVPAELVDLVVDGLLARNYDAYTGTRR